MGLFQLLRSNLLDYLRVTRKNYRIMRKHASLLNALLNQSTQGVLEATLLQDQRAWYLSDLAAHLGLRPSSLQRTLAQLTSAGILVREENGNRVYYRADSTCPILPELQSIFIKTTGIAEPLRRALSPWGDRIRAAFIHGSIAEGRERSESDIDLIVIGDVANAQLAGALRPLRERLGREINVTRYSPTEWIEKIASGHHFVTSVLKKPRIFLIGDEHELEQIAGRQARGSRTVQQAGT